MKWPWVSRKQLQKEYNRGRKEARYGLVYFSIPSPVTIHVMTIDDGRPTLSNPIYMGMHDSVHITHNMLYSNQIVIDTFPGALQRAQELVVQKQKEPPLLPEHFFPELDE